MPAPRNDALARFVLAPTKVTNRRSLDQQWGDLAGFLRGPASALARWLAVAQMHSVYRQMRLHKSPDERKLQNLTVGHFVERACAETGLSRPTLYAYIDRSRGLVEALGPSMLKEMLSGRERIANDENLLIKVAQLPAAKAIKVVETYMRGGKSEAAAARLVETYLHKHRLSGLSTHEPRLRGGTIAVDHADGEPIARETRNVVLFGDALVHLQQTIPAESVQCVVCSPPFYAQRDFGTRHWFGGDAGCKHDRRVAHPPFHSGKVAQTRYRTARASQEGRMAVTHSCSRCGAWYGQIGQEPDVGMYVDHLVTIFREVRRVLRKDGVCWIEIGDCYEAGASPYPATPPKKGGSDRKGGRAKPFHTHTPGLVRKNLLLVPARLGLALQEDGWIVRSEIIWNKVASLPESVTDRPTRSHTTIFMLTKSPDYFFDHVAIMEPTAGTAHARGSGLGRKEANRQSGKKTNASFHAATAHLTAVKNCRDVWSFRPGRFAEAHTATFPPELPERCVKASTSEHGACAKCGAPWRRVAAKMAVAVNDKQVSKYKVGRMRAGQLGVPRDAIPAPITIGWEPTCECRTSSVKPCIVLDPFAGSGTTLMVAKKLKRDYVGIELNEIEYRPLIERRLAEASRPHERRTRRAARTSARRS
jgi:DNA modification methylase